jgi:hypothetical protein
MLAMLPNHSMSAAQPPTPAFRSWTTLPLSCWRLLMTHLHSKRSLFSCSVTCSSFANVADELATDLRGVPGPDLARALRRFDRAVSLGIVRPTDGGDPDEAALMAGPSDVRARNYFTNGDPSTLDFAQIGEDDFRDVLALEGPPIEYDDDRRHEITDALMGVTREESNRITHLSISGYPAAHDALADVAETGRWARVRSLELNGIAFMNYREIGQVVDVLPALKHLVVRSADSGVFQTAEPQQDGGDDEAGAGLFDRLESLELVDFLELEGGDVTLRLPVMGKLRRLVVSDMPLMVALPLQGFTSLQVGCLFDSSMGF